MNIFKEMWNAAGELQKEKRAIAKKIAKCFDKKWDTRQFVANGQIIKTEDGETQFYKKSDVDKALAKLDKLVRSLQ